MKTCLPNRVIISSLQIIHCDTKTYHFLVITSCFNLVTPWNIFLLYFKEIVSVHIRAKGKKKGGIERIICFYLFPTHWYNIITYLIFTFMLGSQICFSAFFLIIDSEGVIKQITQNTWNVQNWIKLAKNKITHKNYVREQIYEKKKKSTEPQKVQSKTISMNRYDWFSNFWINVLH